MKDFVLISLSLFFSFHCFSQKDTVQTNELEPLFFDQYVKRDSIKKNGTWDQRVVGSWILISIDSSSSVIATNKNPYNLDSIVFKNNHKLYSYNIDAEKELFWILNDSKDSLHLYHVVKNNEAILKSEPITFNIKKLKRSKLILSRDVHEKENTKLTLTFKKKIV